jgi:hypothetical protein
MKQLGILGAALFLSVVCVNTALAQGRMETISVTVKITGSGSRTYEFEDSVAKRGFEATVTEKGTAISLKSNKALEDGYGSFQYRVKGNSTWNTVTQKRNKDTHSLH